MLATPGSARPFGRRRPPERRAGSGEGPPSGLSAPHRQPTHPCRSSADRPSSCPSLICPLETSLVQVAASSARPSAGGPLHDLHDKTWCQQNDEHSSAASGMTTAGERRARRLAPVVQLHLPATDH